MKTTLKIAILTILATPLFAKTDPLFSPFMDQDALRLTMPSLNGNARFSSMGGAFGALGGNFGALSTNPAGIGIYRRGELSFTPAITIGQTETTPERGRMRASEPLWNFNMGNLGMVSVIDVAKSDSPNEWKKVQFGFGLNRLADFWNRSSYTNYNDWTYLDVLTDQANDDWYNDFDWCDFYTGLLWDAGLIKGQGPFVNDLSSNGGGLMQRHTTKTTGAINEFVISFGANYGDFLYLGATLGLPSVNFSQERFLREVDSDNKHPNFREWTLTENLQVSGRGVNLKLGAIVRPADFMRIGFAYHTPTRYTLKENFYTVVTNSDSRRFRSPETEFDYSIRTPMRLIGSLGFIFERRGLLSFEYEMVNYGRMRLSDNQFYYDDDNDFIADNYQTGGVIRVGGEVRLNALSLRAGYNHTLVPYTNNFERKFSGHTITGGIGFIAGSTTIDLAYVNTIRNQHTRPYPDMPVNRYNAMGHQIMATFGWRF